MSNYRFISDQPIFDSPEKYRELSLNFKTYAKILAKQAAAIDGPFTIGIHGKWGHGKTSLLRAIEEELPNATLNKHQTLVPIRFNAWQFEEEENVFIPLLLTIVTKLENYGEKNKTLQDKLKDISESCLSIVAALCADTETINIGTPFGISIPLKITKLLELFDTSKQKLKVTNSQKVLLSQKAHYYQGFSLLKKTAEKLGSDIKIVLFIDDLDRCDAEKAIDILQNIKLILSQPSFIFFIALDKESLEKYVTSQKKKELGQQIVEEDGKKYFEKLIQVSFTIPQHNYKDNYDKFINLLFTYMNVHKNDPIRDHDIKDIFGNPLDYNPRRVINTLNNIILINSLLRGQFGNEEDLIKKITVEFLMASRFDTFYRAWVNSAVDTKEHFDNTKFADFSAYIHNFDKVKTKEESAKNKKYVGLGSTATQDVKVPESPEEAEYEKLIQLVQSNSSLRYLIVNNAAVRKWIGINERKDEAIKEIRRLVYPQLLKKSNREITQENLNQAAREYNRGNYFDAINYTENALSFCEEQNVAELYFQLGVFNVALLRYREAIQNYTSSLNYATKNEEKASLYSNRASANIYLENYQAVIDDASRAIEIDKENSKAFVNRGYAKYELKDYQGAIDDFTKVTKINKNNSFAYNNLGYIESKLKKYKPAIDDFTKAIEIDKDDALAYYNRGNAKYEIKDYQGAIDDFTKAVEINANYKEAYLKRSDSYKKLKRLKKAKSDEQIFIELEDKVNEPIKLDHALIEELGFADLDEKEEQRFLSYIYNLLEAKVGMNLAKLMNDDQLTEFSKFIDANDENGALKWLEKNFPEYKKVVRDEFKKLKNQIKRKKTSSF